MYEHPYHTYRIIALEQERAALQAERRRMAAEQADRIRTRAGIVARLRDVVARRRGASPAIRPASAVQCSDGQDCAALAL